MKPIDSVTGLPRSAEISRLVSAQVRHGEISGQGQVAAFARELKERENSVGETHKADKGALDTESGGGEGGVYMGTPGEKRDRDKDKDGAEQKRPEKGAILDIRGS